MDMNKKLIKSYIDDEVKASRDYSRLAKQYNDEEIMEISQDEAKHAAFWKKKLSEVMK